jgi:hypothetical protein
MNIVNWERHFEASFRVWNEKNWLSLDQVQIAYRGVSPEMACIRKDSYEKLSFDAKEAAQFVLSQDILTPRRGKPSRCGYRQALARRLNGSWPRVAEELKTWCRGL